MSLQDKLGEQMKAAMRERDKVRLGVLRMVLSELKVAEASGHEFDELSVVKSYAKKLRGAAEEYERLNRADKAQEALAELSIVEEFLPRQMERAEVEKIVGQIIEQNGYGLRDLGKIMKAVMGEHGDRADGRLVQQIAREKLSESDQK